MILTGTLEQLEELTMEKSKSLDPRLCSLCGVDGGNGDAWIDLKHVGKFQLHHSSNTYVFFNCILDSSVSQSDCCPMLLATCLNAATMAI